jgi:hypothetical protein
MYIVQLNPDLLEVNARIRAGRPRRGFTAPAPATLSGTLHNGYNAATAEIAPGSCGTVTVTFQITVLSITSTTFGDYRTLLKTLLGAGDERRIAQAAAIPPLPPPDPASRMATYALELFSGVVFGGEHVAGQSRAFSPTPNSTEVLAATRLLAVTEVTFSGTLTASAATGPVAAYVPITAVEFDDGLTIPFAGYSDNVLVDVGGLKPVDVQLAT